jgi:nuclear migration protein JNM1
VSAKDTDMDDPAELLKGLHNVRTRLEKMGTARENRGRLVDAVIGGGTARPTSSLSHAHLHGHTLPHGHNIMSALSPTLHSAPALYRREGSMHRREGSLSGSQTGAPHSKPDEKVDRGVARLDSRVGALERVVESSNVALHESSPLPPPLLPMLTRLNNQLTILTQPRTIDSISRRLKLLLTDLDRIAAANSSGASSGAGAGGQEKAVNAGGGAGGTATGGTGGGAGGASTIQEQLAPILQRLAPHLPTLPHILARLRTLSSLHAAASDFQRGMEQVRLFDE